MTDLPTMVPDVEVLLALEPEELGSIILKMFRGRHDALISPGAVVSQAWPTMSYGEGRYPRQQQSNVELAVVEAFAWLEATGLLVPAPGPNGANGYRVQSRRARQLKDDSALANFAAADLLPRKLLHEKIRDAAWLAFVRGAYTTAVFEAMREVEIAVREAAHFASGDHGVPMVRRAFHKDTGPLTDPSAEEAEKEALGALFAGAIGSYKNPHSHRRVPLEDAAEAAEIVMLASHLLRIVDARAELATRVV